MESLVQLKADKRLVLTTHILSRVSAYAEQVIATLAIQHRELD
jgi:hypothetical protein